MKQYHIITFGRTKDKGLLAVQEEYTRRLQRYTPVKRTIWKHASKAQASTKVLNYSAAHTKEALLVLDEQGKEMNTTELQKFVEAIHNTQEIVTFVVGDAHGFEDVVQKQTTCLSLSKLTLPHELALTLLMEQLYRIETLKHNHPYHKV